jgi:hypothetical protein
MPRVISQDKSLHKIKDDNNPLSWNDLTNATEMELARLEDRKVKLTRALRVFRKRLEDGAPCIGAEVEL